MRDLETGSLTVSGQKKRTYCYPGKMIEIGSIFIFFLSQVHRYVWQYTYLRVYTYSRASKHAGNTTSMGKGNLCGQMKKDLHQFNFHFSGIHYIYYTVSCIVVVAVPSALISKAITFFVSQSEMSVASKWCFGNYTAAARSFMF